MKKNIRDFDLYNKKVIIRSDLNVPLDKQGNISDDNRIQQSLETIKYALSKGAKVILMSHLGRVKTEEDKIKYTLKPVAERLSQLLSKTVIFIEKTRGETLEKAIESMQIGDVVLIENTRFEDLKGEKESKNDVELGLYWASLGDIFINDAFGTSHRKHASNVGIASHLPSGIGFLVEKEIKQMVNVMENPIRPFTVILGGSKVSDKIGVTNYLVKKADFLLIGGGMAYSFLKAKGYNVGKSLVDEKHLAFCKEILQKYEEKIILPIDTVNVTTSIQNIDDHTPYRTCLVEEMNANEIGLDIGNKTLKTFEKYLEQSKTIIWNGPVGMFEVDHFSNGTKGICSILAHSTAQTIVGGGDTSAAVIQFGYRNKMTHISTGGGASLHLLEGKSLPGIDVIDTI